MGSSNQKLSPPESSKGSSSRPTITVSPLETYPIYIEESVVARRRLWFHSFLLVTTILFSAVTFFTILNLYYRIPGQGTTCELTQDFTSAGLTATSLASNQGNIYCLMGIVIPGLMMTLSIPFLYLSVLMLSRIIAYYRYSLGWSGFLAAFFIILWLFQLATAILLVIGYVNTCSEGVCSQALWPHATLALIGTIFAWLTLLPLVSK
jgi:hypothetical protein